MQNILDLAVPGARELKPYQPGKPIAELEREYGIPVAAIVRLRDLISFLHESPSFRSHAARIEDYRQHYGIRD